MLTAQIILGALLAALFFGVVATTRNWIAAFGCAIYVALIAFAANRFIHYHPW